jgi:hypothetical protein
MTSARPAKPAGPPGGIERRRRRRGLLSRLIEVRIPLPKISPRVRAAFRWTALSAASVVVVGTVVWMLVSWAQRASEIAPADRPEALCFALAAPPVFAPPMRVEPSGAMVRGRFVPGTPIQLALRSSMKFTDDMVISERVRRVGDFEVASVWLHLPGEGQDHWLIVGWMEGPDLAVCNFRFASDSPELTPNETAWGNRLLARILRPQYFRADTLPQVRLRATHGRALPTFGPKAS